MPLSKVGTFYQIKTATLLDWKIIFARYIRDFATRHLSRSDGWKATYDRYCQVHVPLTYFSDVHHEQSLSLPYVPSACGSWLDVRLHHTNDVTRAKYAPMAYHAGHKRMNKIARPVLRIRESFLIPVTRNWNNLSLVRLLILIIINICNNKNII